MLIPDLAFFANNLDHPQVTVRRALAGSVCCWSCFYSSYDTAAPAAGRQKLVIFLYLELDGLVCPSDEIKWFGLVVISHMQGLDVPWKMSVMVYPSWCVCISLLSVVPTHLPCMCGLVSLVRSWPEPCLVPDFGKLKDILAAQQLNV